MFKLSFRWHGLALGSLLLGLTSLAQAADPGIPTRNSINDPRSYNDQKPGSVLVFNYYTSKAANPKGENTEISVTNTNDHSSVAVHLFFISFDCSVADGFLCLVPNQTATLLMSEIDPGLSGYIVAVAVDREDGCPVSFNYLLGSESVKLESGHAADLSALAVAALYPGKLPTCDNINATAPLAFDGIRYNQLPRTLAVDKVRSLADGNAPLLIVTSLNGSLTTGATPVRNLDGELFNDAATSFGFTRACGCGLALLLNDSFPATNPAFSTVVPAGRTGWLKLKARQDLAISGTIINFNAKQVERLTAFNGGHNLHHLELTTSSFVIPIFPPTCNRS